MWWGGGSVLVYCQYVMRFVFWTLTDVEACNQKGYVNGSRYTEYMCMYACMTYICTCTHTHVYMHAPPHTHAHVHVCACSHTHAHTHTHMQYTSDKREPAPFHLSIQDVYNGLAHWYRLKKKSNVAFAFFHRDNKRFLNTFRPMTEKSSVDSSLDILQ